MSLVTTDAGHGGTDPGAVDGVSAGDPYYTEEEDVNLQLTNKLNSALARCKVSYNTTRIADKYLTLQQRCDAANNAHSRVFVSNHHDSAGATAKGISVLYTSAAGKALGACVLKYLQPVSPWPDRGLVQRDNLYVLNHTNMPAILIENGFLTNPQEEALIRSASYQTKLAEATCHGICDYLKVKYVPPAVVTTPPPPKPPVTPTTPTYNWVDAEVKKATVEGFVAAMAKIQVKTITREGATGIAIVSCHCSGAKLQAVTSALVQAGSTPTIRKASVNNKVFRRVTPTTTTL